MQDVIEVCEILNPVVEDILDWKDLWGLGDQFENWNFLLYFVYGLEFKVHQTFEIDGSKEEDENWDNFNVQVKTLRERLIDQLLDLNVTSFKDYSHVLN